MKVAIARPKASRTPVYVTKEKYEVWHSVPLCLGEIEKKDGYWYTKDGMRFVSSRDAMEYLIRLDHLTAPKKETQPPAPIPEEQKKEIASQVIKKKKEAPAKASKKSADKLDRAQMVMLLTELLKQLQSLDKEDPGAGVSLEMQQVSHRDRGDQTDLRA